MDEKERKKRYWNELFTGSMVLGLAMFAVFVLQYLARNQPAGIAMGLLSLANFSVVVAVLVVYGRKVAALYQPDAQNPIGFSYGRAFGFSLKLATLSGIIYGAGYFLMIEVVDPVYFGAMLNQAAELYVTSELMTADQVGEMLDLMHNLFVVIFSNMVVMLFQGGFVALFTAAIVRTRPLY